MDDPREQKHEDHLTEDSDDELADLEKEYAVKRQKLIEERARKKERADQEARRAMQVERSPSPPRKRKEIAEASINNPDKSDPPQDKLPTRKPFGRGNTIKKPAFAEKLYGLKAGNESDINYKERIFEFENLPPRKTENVVEDKKDPVSGFALCQRFFPKETIKELVQRIKVLHIEKLLAKVTPPRFEEPQYDNWCFIGLITYKGAPKRAVNGHQYLQMKVGNFVHTIDLFIFEEAFKKYWKLRVGEVVCILNPKISKIGGNFGLRLSEDLDNVLEIGQLKDFAYCEAQTTAGTQCKHVVDKSQTTLCAFHEEAKYKAGGRMELQGSVKLRGPMGRNGLREAIYMRKDREGKGASGGYGNTKNASGFGAHRSKSDMFSAYSGTVELDQVFNGGEAFDHRQYDKPMVRKSGATRKASENHKQQLETRLLAQVAPRRVEELTKLGIIHQQKTAGDAASTEKTAPKRAFSSKFVNKMGFDPTVDNSGSDKGRASRLESLDELRHLSRGKTVSLEPCEKDKLIKRANFRRNLQAFGSERSAPHNRAQSFTAARQKRSDAPIKIPSHSESKEHVHQEKTIRRTSPGIDIEETVINGIPDTKGGPLGERRMKSECRELVKEDKEDDDDLEISFENDSQRSVYQKATTQHQ